MKLGLATFAAVVAAAPLASCNGTNGTITLSLVTAPGSHVLDAATTLRLILTEPRQVTEAMRGPNGFDLAVDLPAGGADARVIVEGLDSSGAVIATGESPRFPVAAINASITIYMAPPMSIAAAPTTLSPARTDVSGASLSYGAVFAGGKDATGTASDAIAIYNAYNHSLVGGMALPAPRAGITLATGANNIVYLFAGRDATGAPTGTLWRFDTNVAPDGAYSVLADEAGFARDGQRALQVGADRFVISGAPVLELALTTIAVRGGIDSLPPIGASVTPEDGIATAVFASAPIARFRGEALDTLSSQAPAGATIAGLPGGRFVVIGGSRDAIVIDAVTGAAVMLPSLLATARSLPSVAATSRHLVVTGGSDSTGTAIATAEVFDVMTLAPLATIATAPRASPLAIALPNDQVLIAGDGIDLIELFTPDPPP